VKLTVVGSAPAWSRAPGRPSSCYVVEGQSDALVLDMGQGSLGALHGVCEPSSLRAVAISHLHADHHVDLIPLRYLLRFGYAEARSVELHAPAGLRAGYDAFIGEEGFLDGLPGPDLAPGLRVLGSLTLEVAPVTHAAPAFGFRVADAGGSGPGLVYSGDCGEWRDLLALIRPGDTLLSEAFWGTQTPEPGAQHLTAADAAMAAREGMAARLVLTHIEERQDRDAVLFVAREIFGHEVVLAMPGLVVEIAAVSVGLAGAGR
jgi:ribonuclease BN (tRNA processing enzyme)